jgi:transcriptional regulator with XRE-family HTH domain
MKKTEVTKILPSEMLGLIIRSRRVAKGISVKELSEKLGTSGALVYMLETKSPRIRNIPSVELIEKIAKELDLDPVKLTYLAGRYTRHDEERFEKGLETLQKRSEIFYHKILNEMHAQTNKDD